MVCLKQKGPHLPPVAVGSWIFLPLCARPWKPDRYIRTSPCPQSSGRADRAQLVGSRANPGKGLGQAPRKMVTFALSLLGGAGRIVLGGKGELGEGGK